MVRGSYRQGCPWLGVQYGARVARGGGEGGGGPPEETRRKSTWKERVLGPAKKVSKFLFPLWLGHHSLQSHRIVRPRRQMRQKYQVGCCGCMAREAPCSLRTTAVQKVLKAGRMRSRPAEMSTSTRGAEARGQDDRGRRWVSAGDGTIGLACASEASFCPTQSSSGPRLRIDIQKLSRANRVLAPGRRRATTQSTLACRRDCGRRSAVSCRPNDALHVSHPGFWPARRIPSLAPCLCPLAASPVRGVCDGCRVARSRIVVGRLLDVGDPVNARPDSVSPSAAHLPICPSHPPTRPRSRIRLRMRVSGSKTARALSSSQVGRIAAAADRSAGNTLWYLPRPRRRRAAVLLVDKLSSWGSINFALSPSRNSIYVCMARLLDLASLPPFPSVRAHPHRPNRASRVACPKAKDG